MKYFYWKYFIIILIMIEFLPKSVLGIDVVVVIVVLKKLFYKKYF
jgi:hypothetical protein